MSASSRVVGLSRERANQDRLFVTSVLSVTLRKESVRFVMFSCLFFGLLSADAEPGTKFTLDGTHDASRHGLNARHVTSRYVMDRTARMMCHGQNALHVTDATRRTTCHATNRTHARRVRHETASPALITTQRGTNLCVSPW